MLRIAPDWIQKQSPLGAWLDGDVVAVVRLEDLGEGEGWCGGLRVAPELRRKGIGRMIMEYLMTVAKVRGIAILRDLIEEDNTPSRQLARSLGFRELMMASHLAGTFTPGQRKVSATAASTVPDIGRLSWVRALGGYMVTTGPERFRFARATKDRLAREVEWGTLYDLAEDRGCFLLSKPVRIAWANRIVRSFAPLNGPLEDLIDAAESQTGGDGSRVDGFLPIDARALQVAEDRGWKPGEMWGMRIVLCERSLA
jgi:hypothetical protein